MRVAKMLETDYIGVQKVPKNRVNHSTKHFQWHWGSKLQSYRLKLFIIGSM